MFTAFHKLSAHLGDTNMMLSINNASKLMRRVQDNIALVIHGKEEKRGD